MNFKGDDSTLTLAVIENAQIALNKIIDWNTLEIGCMKGEADFVDGDVQGVGIVSDWRCFCSLRQSNGDCTEEAKRSKEVGMHATVHEP